MKIFKKDFIVGLDIGTSSVKLAQFKKTEDGLRLVKVDFRKIKRTDNKAGRDKEIVSILKDLFRDIKVKRSKVIASINCPQTAMRNIKLPAMPRGELAESIRLEAKNYFPFPLDDAVIDFEIVGEVIEKEVKKDEILIATSPRKTINEYLNLLEQVGIKPASLVPAPYALLRLAELSLSREGKMRCFLDIGSRYTEFAIFPSKEKSTSLAKSKSLIFSRKIPVTGDDFTKVMTATLASVRGKTELSFDEAEEIKRKVGIPAEGESKIISDKISTTQILSMLRAPLEQLVNEIDRYFDYYKEESEGGSIDALILYGAGSSLHGISEFLSKGLGIEVRVGNPLEELKNGPSAISDKDKDSHQIALAIGAALSEAKGINLLPPEIREETKRTFERSTIEAITVGVTLILVFIYIGMKIQLSNFQKRIAVSKMELSSLNPQLKQIEMYSILNDEPYWEDIFRDLSNIMPPDIYLTSLNMESRTIKMRGIITSDEPEESLSKLIISLEKGAFKNVKLVTTKEIKEKSSNEFELVSGLD